MDNSDNKSVSAQPASEASGQQSPAAKQPPIMNSIEAPKKKRKKGLIIGIVSGVIALILLVTAVLLYFLWWQHPQNIVDNAVMSAARVTKARTNGKMTMKFSDQAKVEFDITSNAADSKTKTDIAATITVNTLSQTLHTKVTVMSDNKGALYIKFDDLRGLVNTAVGTMIDAQAQAQGAYGTVDRAQIEGEKRKALAELEPKIAKIDGKWLKVSPETVLSEASQDGSKCFEELAAIVRDDKRALDEAINVYKKHNFLVVDPEAKVESRNGAPGFEIDLSPNGESARRAKEFSAGMKETTIGKKMIQCYGERIFDSSRSSRSSGKVTLRVWADSWSHQLKAFAIKASDVTSGMELDLVIDVEQGKSDAIEVPTDTADFKQSFESVFGQQLSVGDDYDDTDFDFDGESI